MSKIYSIPFGFFTYLCHTEFIRQFAPCSKASAIAYYQNLQRHKMGLLFWHILMTSSQYLLFSLPTIFLINFNKMTVYFFYNLNGRCKNALLVVRIYPDPNLPILYLSAVKTIYCFANRMLIQHFNRSIIACLLSVVRGCRGCCQNVRIKINPS